MLQGVTLWLRKCIALSNINGPFDSSQAPGDTELTSKRQWQSFTFFITRCSVFAF